MLSRRVLLERSLKISAGLALGRASAGFAGVAALLTIKRGSGAPVDLPANFIGLGYEMSSVAAPGLLSINNQRYVDLIAGLGHQGVLRVGGIVADYTRYDPNGTGIAERQNTVINRTALEQFAAFLKRIGWSAIWSVNFAQGSIDDAVTEACAAADALGPQLLAIEIGNEVNNYGRGQKPFRKPPYDYQDYRREYTEWHAAIAKAVPQIHFAAPDTAGAGSSPTPAEWFERLALDAQGDVQLLTTHYYRNGQARGSAEQLLNTDPALRDALTRMRSASQQSGIPWRMCETNSFSGGGRPGVSDTFLAALWTLDYMLLLAQYGCSGVNIETGVNQLGLVSSYSPIQDDGKGMNSAGVSYYGMLAFATARIGCSQIMPIDIDAQGINVTAYLLGANGKPLSVVIVNRDSTHDANLSIESPGLENVLAHRLVAPSSESKTDVTFAGASVDAEGRWRAKTNEHVPAKAVTVPRMSAVVCRFLNPHGHPL